LAISLPQDTKININTFIDSTRTGDHTDILTFNSIWILYLFIYSYRTGRLSKLQIALFRPAAGTVLYGHKGPSYPLISERRFIYVQVWIKKRTKEGTWIQLSQKNCQTDYISNRDHLKQQQQQQQDILQNELEQNASSDLHAFYFLFLCIIFDESKRRVRSVSSPPPPPPPPANDRARNE
jgi:hypothetical protein